MAGDELMRRVAVAMFAPALGQHVFFLPLQHGEPPNSLEIPGETGFNRRNRQVRGVGHDSALQVASADRRAIAPSRLEGAPRAARLVICPRRIRSAERALYSGVSPPTVQRARRLRRFSLYAD